MLSFGRSLLALVVLGSATLGAACSGEASPPACSTYEAATSVEAQDFDYGPRCIEATAGDTLTVENTGDASHTFTVDDTDVNVDVSAGASATVGLEGLTVGTVYTVKCIYHPQMTAALKIS